MEHAERRVELPRIPVRRLSVVAIVLVLIAGGALLLSVGRVDVGYVAVIVDPIMGTVTAEGDGATARYFLKPPWANLIQIYVATDSVDMWTERDPVTGVVTYGTFRAVPCLTKEGLGVEADITVRWTITPGKVMELYKRYPALDWKDRAIIPIVRRVIRDAVAQFTAMETIEQREALGVGLRTSLIRELQKESSLVNATILGAVDLREIALPSRFVEAIEAKLAAEQLAIAAEFNRTRILVMANATAQSAIIQAQGIATSRIIIANATYESLKAIAGESSSMNMTQLTFLYLTLEALKEIAATGQTVFLIVTGEAGTWILPIPPPA